MLVLFCSITFHHSYTRCLNTSSNSHNAFCFQDGNAGEQTTKNGRKKSLGKRQVVTLLSLLEAKLVSSGTDCMTTNYKEVTYTANLTADGKIYQDGTTYVSPSSWSLAIKQRVNPTRKADDGWKCVKYQGTLLEHLKSQFLGGAAHIAAEDAEGNDGGDGKAPALVSPQTHSTSRHEENPNPCTPPTASQHYSSL